MNLDAKLGFKTIVTVSEAIVIVFSTYFWYFMGKI